MQKVFKFKISQKVVCIFVIPDIIIKFHNFVRLCNRLKLEEKRTQQEQNPAENPCEEEATLNKQPCSDVISLTTPVLNVQFDDENAIQNLGHVS